MVKVACSIVVALLGSYPTYLLVLPFWNWSLKRFAPSWYIDAEASVVKVYGDVAPSEWDDVKRLMLQTRRGLMPVQDPHRRFGCTMAAEPATDEYIRRQRLTNEPPVDRLETGNSALSA